MYDSSSYGDSHAQHGTGLTAHSLRTLREEEHEVPGKWQDEQTANGQKNRGNKHVGINGQNKKKKKQPRH